MAKIRSGGALKPAFSSSVRPAACSSMFDSGTSRLRAEDQVVVRLKTLRLRPPRIAVSSLRMTETSVALLGSIRVRVLRRSDAEWMTAAYRRNREHLAPWEPLRAEEFFTDCQPGGRHRVQGSPCSRQDPMFPGSCWTVSASSAC